MTSPAPHRDPATFDEVIASVSPESILVVIRHSMHERLRAAYEPEDVWQETLAHAWRDGAQHEWQGPGPYRTWLITIARNRIRDLGRTLNRAKRGAGGRPALFSALDAEGADLASLLPAGSTTPSRVAGHHERARMMDEAMASLPDDQRDLVRMHLFEEVPMTEIAASLGIPLDTAWYRFRKGAASYARQLKALDSRQSPPSPPG